MQIPAEDFVDFECQLSPRAILAILKEFHGSAIMDDVVEKAYEAYRGEREVPSMQWPSFA